MFVSNPWNDNFNELLFDGHQSLITRQQIYRVNYDIIERLNNGFIVDVCTNIMLE